MVSFAPATRNPRVVSLAVISQAASVLPAAMQVLAAGDFRYVRKIVGETDAVLEFVAEVDGITVNGFDLVHSIRLVGCA